MKLTNDLGRGIGIYYTHIKLHSNQFINTRVIARQNLDYFKMSATLEIQTAISKTIFKGNMKKKCFGIFILRPNPLMRHIYRLLFQG